MTNGGGELTQMGSRGVERASVPKIDLGEQTCPLLFFRLLSSLLINYKFVHPFSSRRRWKGPDRWHEVRPPKTRLHVHLVCYRASSDHENAFFSYLMGAAGRDGLVEEARSRRRAGRRAGRACFSVTTYDAIDDDVARIKDTLRSSAA